MFVLYELARSAVTSVFSQSAPSKAQLKAQTSDLFKEDLHRRVSELATTLKLLSQSKKSSLNQREFVILVRQSMTLQETLDFLVEESHIAIKLENLALQNKLAKHLKHINTLMVIKESNLSVKGRYVLTPDYTTALTSYENFIKKEIEVLDQNPMSKRYLNIISQLAFYWPLTAKFESSEDFPLKKDRLFIDISNSSESNNDEVTIDIHTPASIKLTHNDANNHWIATCRLTNLLTHSEFKNRDVLYFDILRSISAILNENLGDKLDYIILK